MRDIAEGGSMTALLDENGRAEFFREYAAERRKVFAKVSGTINGEVLALTPNWPSDPRDVEGAVVLTKTGIRHICVKTGAVKKEGSFAETPQPIRN